MTASTLTRFACPEHAPAGISPVPNDDGRPSCSICGTANYAVKPFEISIDVVARGYWRLADGGTAEIRGGVQASSLQAPAAVRRTNAERQRGDVVDECFVCGRGLSERGLERASWIEHTTSGYLVAVASESPDSQGCFPVGSECAKTVPAAFRLKGIR